MLNWLRRRLWGRSKFAWHSGVPICRDCKSEAVIGSCAECGAYYCADHTPRIVQEPPLCNQCNQFRRYRDKQKKTRGDSGIAEMWSITGNAVLYTCVTMKNGTQKWMPQEEIRTLPTLEVNDGKH